MEFEKRSSDAFVHRVIRKSPERNLTRYPQILSPTLSILTILISPLALAPAVDSCPTQNQSSLPPPRLIRRRLVVAPSSSSPPTLQIPIQTSSFSSSPRYQLTYSWLSWFEPLIVAIKGRDIEAAQFLLSLAMSSGFRDRESGLRALIITERMQVSGVQ